MIKFNIRIGNYVKINYSTFINGIINKNTESIIKGKEKMSNCLNTLNDIKIKFNDGGGHKARMRQNKLNKLLVDERINILYEKDFFEIGFFAGYGQDYGDIPKGGCTGGIGYINKRLCVCFIYDSTVKGGSSYPIQVRKQTRMHDIALNLSLPFLIIPDSGGVFLPLQADIFADKDFGGRIFYNLVMLQRKGLPVISLICGQATAGAAYIAVMSTETGMVQNNGQFFLGGPPLVKAATGEICSAEDLGGAVLHTKISGCSDYKFQTEIESLLHTREFLSNLPEQEVQSGNLKSPLDPFYSSNELNWLTLNFGITEEESKTSMMQILARVLDGSCIDGFKSEYGTNLITGTARISGYLVGILASHGKLSEKDCMKGSHFIQICGHRNITIISFVHSVDGSELENNIDTPLINGDQVIKAKSSMMRSLATRNCKLITVVIGDAVGMDYICMGGRSMNADFIFAWPNARFGWHTTDLEDITKSSVFKAAGNLVVDEIIEPSTTRMVLKTYLDILHTKSNLLPDTQVQPVYRF